MKELLPSRAAFAVPFVVGCLQPLSAQAAWTRLYPAQSPPRLQLPVMAYDPARGETVTYGLLDSPSVSAQTWIWNGTGWRSAGTTGPSPRTGPGMAADPSRSRVVLFGGLAVSGVTTWHDDLWEWDGTSWAQRTAVSRPSGRHFPAMAFDPRAGAVMLFGGALPSGYSNEVWLWNGAQWQQAVTTSGPSPRDGAALAFDPNTRTMLLFGGSDGIPRDDTWSWDGTAWQQHTPATPPWPRLLHAMATDEARSRVVLFGGFETDPYVWEWDGANWLHGTGVGPAPRRRPGVAYDVTRRELVLFGGNARPVGDLDDTWVHRTAQPASFTAYGQGCPGSLGTPQLTNVPYRLPWLGDALATQVTGVPATPVAPVAFVTGLRATPPLSLSLLGLPGCSSFLSLDDVLLTFATNGTATRTIPIPNAPQLAGAHLFQQALVFDGAAPGGAVVSNAGEAILGIR